MRTFENIPDSLKEPDQWVLWRYLRGTEGCLSRLRSCYSPRTCTEDSCRNPATGSAARTRSVTSETIRAACSGVNHNLPRAIRRKS